MADVSEDSAWHVESHHLDDVTKKTKRLNNARASQKSPLFKNNEDLGGECYPYFRDVTRGMSASMTWTSPVRGLRTEVAHGALFPRTESEDYEQRGPTSLYSQECTKPKAMTDDIRRHESKADVAPLPRDPTTGRSWSSEPSSWPSSFRAVSFTKATFVALFRVVGRKVKRGMSPCAA